MSPFITFEGIEGSGKSTQLRRLAAALRARGHDVLETREPGGTAVGSALRSIVLDPAHGSLTPLAELLLYCADRAQHVEECIRPALAAGRVVLSDRFSDSMIAYQGFGRGLDFDLVRTMDANARGGMAPHLTVLFDCPVGEGLARAKGRSGTSDRLEAAPLDFHQRVRDGFLTLAREEPDRYVVVDTTKPVDDVGAVVLARVQRVLEAR